MEPQSYAWCLINTLASTRQNERIVGRQACEGLEDCPDHRPSSDAQADAEESGASDTTAPAPAPQARRELKEPEARPLRRCDCAQRESVHPGVGGLLLAPRRDPLGVLREQLHRRNVTGHPRNGVPRGAAGVLAVPQEPGPCRRMLTVTSSPATSATSCSSSTWRSSSRCTQPGRSALDGGGAEAKHGAGLPALKDLPARQGLETYSTPRRCCCRCVYTGGSWH